MILLSSAKKIYGELIAECLIKPETIKPIITINKVLSCNDCTNCCKHVGTNFTENNYECDELACKHLTKKGCGVHDEKRPIACSLYPFNVYADKKDNEYIIQIRMTNCTGKPEIVNPTGSTDKLKESLTELIIFGINPINKTLYNALEKKLKETRAS